MTDSFLFLDAEIPFFAGAGGQSHELRGPCEQILQAAENGAIRVAIDAEVIQELVYRCGFLREWDLGLQSARRVMALADQVFPISKEVVHRMVQLIDPFARNGFPAPVLIHTAVMQHHGLNSVISFDTNFDAIPEFTRLDPVALAASL